VQSDLDHLASELSDQERLKVSAAGTMQELSAKIKEAEGRRTRLTRERAETNAQGQKGLPDGLAADLPGCADGKQEIASINEQMVIFRQAKAKAQELLAEATSSAQTLRTETQEKEIESRDLQCDYETKVHQCKTRVQDILYTDMCAVRVVRDAVMSRSEVSPPTAIGDCDITDWVSGPCSVDCDDKCPAKFRPGTDPYACGGNQKLTREMVAAPNQYGMACPAMTMIKKCNQIRCPVNCKVSEWSGFSKCTADCGGGQQQRTRSILVKPRNGGAECDSALEERPCNTGSCNRDCVLNDWSEWAGCSAACGGGVRSRARGVLAPIRALGKCPAETHPDRLEEEQCNTQACYGDEVCVAKQDLVVAIDASGSEEDGFQRIRTLAANLTGRYRSTYYGKDRMKVGALLFGQGQQMRGGYTSAAEEVSPLTSDLASVTRKIEGLAWKRGAPNMMQALSLADKMLERGRADAQSAILVITDSPYASSASTSNMFQHLKDKNVHIFMAPINQVENSDDLEVLKAWASWPWQQNFELIPGHDALTNNHDDFAEMLVARFCPDSFSPTLRRSSGEADGYTLVRAGAYPSHSCAAYAQMPKRYAGPEDCYFEMRSLHSDSFAFTFMKGPSRSYGTCFSEDVNVTSDMWQEYLDNATDVPCPGGDWEENPYAYTYFMRPEASSLA
jgi:hypothetical protein